MEPVLSPSLSLSRLSFSLSHQDRELVDALLRWEAREIDGHAGAIYGIEA